MKLSCSNIKKTLILQETETLTTFLFFLYFRKQNPRKNFLYFIKRKFFLYFGKQKPPKNSLYSGKFFILGNGNPNKLPKKP